MENTGFITPAEEYSHKRLDFNRALRPFPACEFEFRYKGHEMESWHIQDGDLLIIDRSVRPFDGCIAIVVHENSFLCRQILFSKKWNCYVFMTEGRWERVREVFGVAMYNIHTLSGNRL